MPRDLSLEELRQHLERARTRLAQEKIALQKMDFDDPSLNHEAYAFTYIRAERIGLRAIKRKLAEISWLPLQLDPKAEVAPHGHAALKRWVASAVQRMPSSEEFGNDFIHALTRCAVTYGFERGEFLRMASRIANLFRDLSCLVGLIYYGTWLNENKVASVRLSDPDDLLRSAAEITALVQTPDVVRIMRAHEQQNEKKASSARKPSKTSARFHVIENTHYQGSLFHPPA